MTHVLIILWRLFFLLACLSRKIWEDTLFSAMPPFIRWLWQSEFNFRPIKCFPNVYSQSEFYQRFHLAGTYRPFQLSRPAGCVCIHLAGLPLKGQLTGLHLERGPVDRQVHTWLVPNEVSPWRWVVHCGKTKTLTCASDDISTQANWAANSSLPSSTGRQLTSMGADDPKRQIKKPTLRSSLLSNRLFPINCPVDQALVTKAPSQRCCQ